MNINQGPGFDAILRRFSLYVDAPTDVRLRLEILQEDPRIPDRRADIMKYRSGNARRAPTRGVLLYPRVSRSSPSLFSFALPEQNSFVPHPRSGYLSRGNFPTTLERGRWPISCGDAILIPSKEREIKQRRPRSAKRTDRNDFFQ